MSYELKRNRETYTNTLKMMGLSGRDTLTVVDGIFSLRNMINPTVKGKIIAEIGDVVVLDKPIKDWWVELMTDTVKLGNKNPQPDAFGRVVKYKVSNYPYSNIDVMGLHSLVDFMLQKYYAKSLVTQN